MEKSGERKPRPPDCTERVAEVGSLRAAEQQVKQDYGDDDLGRSEQEPAPRFFHFGLLGHVVSHRPSASAGRMRPLPRRVNSRIARVDWRLVSR